MDIDFVITGQRIREARKYRGLTADVLAEKVGLATESLRHIENASSKPGLNTLFKIATELDVSLDYITGRTSELAVSLAGRGLTPAQEQMVQAIVNGVVPVIVENF